MKSPRYMVYEVTDIHGSKMKLDSVENFDERFAEVVHCKDCKRNADNGGVYPDGKTQCPIQEHYALLQDGFCHLGERIETK